MSTTGTFHAAQFTSVRIGCYYHSKYGQLVFSGLTATGSNGFSGQWFPGDGTHDPAALPWDTDADLSALRTAVQYGTIPSSPVVWIIGPGVDGITWDPDGVGYPFRLQPVLSRLDPFREEDALESTDTGGTRTSHWYEVGTGAPPTVATPSLAAYPDSSIESIMSVAGWTVRIPTGDPLFVVEVIEYDDQAYLRGPHTSTRCYSVDGGETWTTIRPTTPASITDIQEYLHGTWMTTGAPIGGHDDRLAVYGGEPTAVDPD